MRLFRHQDSRLEYFFVTTPHSLVHHKWEFLPCLKVFPVSKYVQLYIVHELGGFFSTTHSRLALHRTRSPLHDDTGHIYFHLSSMYLGWGDKEDQNPSLGMLEFHQRQRETEREI